MAPPPPAKATRRPPRAPTVGPSAAERHRSSATPLALVMAALIVYASLYPFTGWRVPAHVSPWAFLTLPLPRWWTWFDVISNFFGYLPLGALVFGAGVRSGGRPLAVAVAALLLGTTLSAAMETLQNDLPTRVSSNLDLALNAAGNAAGVGLGAAVHRLGGVERWQRVRDHWFVPTSRGALALLVLWPTGLLFPPPVPFGVGDIWQHLAIGAQALLDGTSWAGRIGWQTAAASPAAGLSPGEETLAVLLGLISPCLVAYSVSRPGWRRSVFVLGAVALGSTATTLSTALNFGPDHAFGWWNDRVAPACLGAAVLALVLAPLPRRAAAGAGLIALTGLVTLVSRAPSDPYLVQSLQDWEQGRFIRFHGVAQWIGWLWPYAAIAYLLTQLGATEPASEAAPQALGGRRRIERTRRSA